MKFKSDSVHYRERTRTKMGGRVLTDPSFAHDLDINVIMNKYSKTGVLPHFPEKTPQFFDVSEVPTLIESKRASNLASKSFQDLPLEIRQACNHDPSKLEILISQNPALCLKHGLLEERPKPEPKMAKKETKNESKPPNNSDSTI